jgi:RNA polymerase sigma factor (sigma-70 family)
MRSTKVAAMDDPPSEQRRATGTSSYESEFTAFYRAEHEPQVRRAALMLGSGEAAHDVVHEAMASMYRRWSTIDTPGSYLNRAVLNGCRAVVRSRVADRRVQQRLRPVDDDSSPDDVLFDVLARLPFNQRAAVVMRYFARMTEGEIADALDTRPGSIGPWIHRALTTMRKELS